MSFLSPESPALSSSKSTRRSTYQEAEVLPFVNGFFRIAPKWITDRFNDHWSNGSTTGQAFCSVAGLLCHGPVKNFRSVIVSGEVATIFDFERPDDPTHPNYYFVAFEFGGTDAQVGVTNKGRLYWGREDQPADEWLRTKTGQNHPAYRGQAYVVFERIHCGQIQANTKARPALPQIEFSGIRLPSPTLPTGLQIPNTLTVPKLRGVNLVSALYDALTHPRGGLGLVDALDTDDWIARAQAIESGDKPAGGAYGDPLWISPVHAGGEEAEKIVSDYLSYIDGFLYTVGGKLRIGWFPNDGVVPTGIPEISHHDLVEVLDFSTATYAETPTQIVVSGLEALPNDGTELSDAVETAQVPFVRALTGGENRVEKLERPWFTHRDVLAAYAHRVASTRTIPAQSGKFVCLPSRAVRADGSPLRPGDLVRLNWQPMQLLIVARITERSDTADGAELSWERERGTTPLPYTAPTDPRSDYTLPEPTAPSADDWAVVSAPPGLSNIGLVAFVSPPQTTLSGARVWYDPDGTWDAASVLLGAQGFSVKVSVTGLSASDTTATLLTDDPNASAVLGSGENVTGQEDDSLLLVVGNEWMSLGSVTSSGGGAYSVALARARLGSVAAAHEAATGWVIRRNRLVVWQHANFSAGDTAHVKVQTYHPLAESPLSTEKTVTLVENDNTVTGYMIDLSTYAHTVACSSDGTPAAGQLGASGIARTSVSVLKGNMLMEAVDANPAAGQFAIAVGALSHTTATKENANTVRCDSLTADVGTIAITVSVAGKFVSTKIFALAKVKAGASGTPGNNGASGTSAATIYVVAASQPATPTGSNPLGWSASIPSGVGAVWASTGTKDLAGNLIGVWSTPRRISGSVTFTQPTDPSTTFAVLAGDIWFDTTGAPNGIRIKVRNSANNGWSDNTINQLSVSQLLAGTIGAVSIVIGNGGEIKTADYVQGTSGLRFGADGNIDINAAMIRGDIARTGSMFHPNYRAKKFAPVAYVTTFQHSQPFVWSAGSNWSTNQISPLTCYCPGHPNFGSGGSVKVCPDQDGNIKVMFNASIFAFTQGDHALTLYYRINDGGRVALVATASQFTDGAVRSNAFRTIPAGLTDKIEIFLWPGDYSGNLSNTTGAQYELEATFFNW